MSNKKLSQFNQITTLTNGTHKVPLFNAGVDNYWADIDDSGRAFSFWANTGTATAYAGGGQANATTVANKWTIISTCATDGDSMKMPAALANSHYMIVNLGANCVNLYPASGENFSGLGANVPIKIPVKTYMELLCTTTGVWYYRPIISVYTGEDSITAYAGGGQANATQLTVEFNNVKVVATNGDSVKLKYASKDLRMIVVNSDSAQSLNIFPKTGQNIAPLAVNLAVSCPAGQSMEFFCFTEGTWTIL